jgi:hypothetical protein
MAIGALQLGPLRLRAPTTWEFFPFENVILGSASRRGSLQITLAYANDAPGGAGHEACIDIVRRYMDESASRDLYSERVQQNDAVFGFVTAHDAKVLGRCWYRFKNGRLVLALFQCGAENFAQVQAEIEEASAIAATMELVG